MDNLETAAFDLIAYVYEKYPGEALRCPYMRRVGVLVGLACGHCYHRLTATDVGAVCEHCGGEKGASG